MKVGIMQPYFFPYIGYFSLIKHTDKFILSDVVQFIYHGWIERNRILKPNEGWHYINVPLQKFHYSTPIREVMINNNIDWKGKIYAQLKHYKQTAPYYYSTINLLNEIFSFEFFDIVTLNKISLTKVCEYLGFSKKIEVFSEMNLSILPVNAPDEWSLNTCLAIEGANEYWNPPGGQSFYDKVKYDKANINLKFMIPCPVKYDQKRSQFEKWLSIIDVLMFNSVENVNKMLDNYNLE